MKSRVLSSAAALAVAAALAAPSMAEEIPLTKLYQDLAAHNHYQAAEGLKDAQVEVKCNIMEQLVAAFPDAAGKPITVKYYWYRANENAAPQTKLVVSGVPDGLTDLSNRTNQLFQMVSEFAVQAPVYWQIANTNAKAVNDGGKITVTGEAKQASDAVKKMIVDIDGGSYKVGRIQFDLGQAQVSVEMTSKDMGGKWGPETTTIANPQYKQAVKFDFTQADAFWFPSRITIDLLKPDGSSLGQPRYVFDFSGWQVNKGLPAGVF